MKIIVSLDRYDGAQSQAITCDMEEFPTRDMIWKMMEGDVCGFTVTKLVPLQKLMKKLENTNETS